jgi:hypothetical protein
MISLRELTGEGEASGASVILRKESLLGEFETSDSEIIASVRVLRSSSQF